jgi:hypothetical protein
MRKIDIAYEKRKKEAVGQFNVRYLAPAQVVLEVVPPWYQNGFLLYPSAAGVFALVFSHWCYLPAS